ncbi:MAG: urea carboxylase [Syntrophobacteraceae bacterium]
MFRKVLVANRGEIACRIIRTLRRMEIASVAVYSEADAGARHVLEADEAYAIGPPPAAQSYLDAEKILAVASEAAVDAIHPGYGFLSENAGFAEACAERGIVFIGPTPRQLRDFGLKHRAREIAAACGAPLLPGSGLLQSADEACEAASTIGYPVMLKSTAGGGGIGMSRCDGEEELRSAFDRIERLSRNNFGDAGIFLEKLIERARHIEVQVFGDGRGEALALGERDCSVQRRNQKVIEETPAPGLAPETRLALHETARRLAASVSYASAGTVEFIFDAATGEFYFLEVNTRLQVEHGVTEAVLGIDLVEWMLRLAAGERPKMHGAPRIPRGVAIEARIYAEDPGRNFQPGSGVLTEVRFPEGVRCDGWVRRGSEITSFYDPLLAKLIVWGADRAEAIAALRRALDGTRLAGLETNLLLLRQVAGMEDFAAGSYTTRLLEGFEYSAPTIEVEAPGAQTTVQDYPGRLGYWAVGAPPSGPMDALGFRLANRAVGNAPDAAGLEVTAQGPRLRFNRETVIALTGADMGARIDGVPAPTGVPLTAREGAVLECGALTGGQRAYIAVRGGIDAPLYMGSRSTFILGRFGGHGGRALRAGDVLHIGSMHAGKPRALPETARLRAPDVWKIGVLYGPHGAPEFFTEADMEAFFDAEWEVHYNSSRTGVRLIGPKPEWARPDGGEAGLHPSNIHDNAYAVGTIDFTGDMPIILGPDGPSLGGFVCPATIVQAELWKVGQLRPGDRVRFVRLTQRAAEILESAQERFIETLEPSIPKLDLSSARLEPAIVAERPAEDANERIVYRRAGDKYLLIEYGPPVLDLKLRFRVHRLMLYLEKLRVPGVIDLTPGVRSLQVHYDNWILPLPELLALLRYAEDALGAERTATVPARIVHLPLSWDDAATRLAIEKYTQSVRKDAPWCPSNIEFIRRVNGLKDVEEVKKIVFDASYLVIGLGDVYLGAPVATPIDPRHRLVTTKYNPARTWTPENAVGIGGAYLCVYGMEGPGGYQFVGRTVQMWNRYNVTREFEPGKPWLLRFFDQIRFYPVSHEELMRMRRDFPEGKTPLQIEETTFSLEEYEAFVEAHREQIDAFKAHQQAAFDAERERWIENGQLTFDSEEANGHREAEEREVLEGCAPVHSPVSGSVWKLHVEVGSAVAKGDAVAVLESMKTEITVMASSNGVVRQLFCMEGELLQAGQALISIEWEEEE